MEEGCGQGVVLYEIAQDTVQLPVEHPRLWAWLVPRGDALAAPAASVELPLDPLDRTLTLMPWQLLVVQPVQRVDSTRSGIQQMVHYMLGRWATGVAHLHCNLLHSTATSLLHSTATYCTALQPPYCNLPTALYCTIGFHLQYVHYE